MASITPPPDPISLRFPSQAYAELVIRKFKEAGLNAEQISMAHQNSAVLSAANNPATYRATGDASDPDRDRPLTEEGFYVRSQEEFMDENTPVMVSIQAEPGQEDLIEAILTGCQVERINPKYRRRFMPGSTAATPELLPNERAGNNPGLWWQLRQRVRFMPTWAKAVVLIGAGAALSLGATNWSREPRRRMSDQGTARRLPRTA
jgi:hypothetical protein